MINYYKKSKKAFKEYVKKNPNCSKDKWDKYAQENCLFSANAIMFHTNVESFEKLKEKFS